MSHDPYAPQSRRLPPGTRLNGIFEVDQVIAQGGMGEIYRGRTVETGDPVAIKMLLPEMAENEAALALFRKEASALHNLHHEAIVRYYVFTVEPVLQRPYLAMEFVEGKSLGELLKSGPLSFESACTLLQRLAAGLQVAHVRGIVHRDVSPDNIIIPDADVARAKIIDFGIARQTQLSEGTVIGTGFAGKYNYVSPEQLGLAGGDVTPKSDIYSLGLVIVEALTGQPLDMAGSQFDVVEKRRRVPELGFIDPRIRPLITAMLQPLPADRPASMAEVTAWPIGAANPGATARDAGSVRSSDDRRTGRGGEPAVPKRGAGKRVALAATALLLIGGGAGAAYYYAVMMPDALVTAPAAPRLDPLGRPSTDTAAAGSPPLLRPVDRLGPTGDEAGNRITAETPLRPQESRPQETRPAEMARPQGPAGAVVAVAPSAEQSTAPYNPLTPSRPTDAKSAGPSAEASAAPTLSPSLNPAARQESNANTAGTPLPSAPAPSPPVNNAPSKNTQTAALPTPSTKDPIAPLRRRDQIERYISQYEGGECFYISPVAVTDQAATIEGYGQTVAPFQALDEAFRRNIGFEADIGLRKVTPAQCAAINFLGQTRHERGPAPQINVGETNLRGGQALSGTLSAPPNQHVDLLLVSDDGTVQNVSRLLKPGADGRTFNMRMSRTGAGGAQPQLLVAVASAKPLDSLTHLKDTAPADELFPKVLAEAARAGQPIKVAAKYFKLDQ